MPPEALFDVKSLQLDRVLVDVEGIRKINPQRTIEIQLAGADHLATAEQFAQEAEPQATVTRSDAEFVVRFRTARTEQDLGKLLSRLVQTGVLVTQFREVQSDLEEAFMTVAKESA